MRITRTLEASARAVLSRLDAWMNRLYGSKLNPLYHSGAVVVALLAVLILTGLYLLLFYRIGSPYGSVEGITAQVWVGRWVRGLHRYASDAAVVAIVVHAFRMFAQGRSWGPRALAWVSGLVLLLVMLVCGWTGYVMVWDVQAQLLAVEGARFLDVLPLFSEPIARLFVGEQPLPAAFFFLNLFLHIALPIGVALLLWVHVARVARPTLLPPRPLLWGVVGLLLVLSVAWPVGMAPPAEALRLPVRGPIDVFYAFWLPYTRVLPAWAVWVVGTGLSALVLSVPLWARPESAQRPAPSVVDERLCTGCEQCYLDCPYEAIRMVPRTDGRPGEVARVDGSLCVSCGICAGSCAPMGVGPPERTGRDQLKAVKAFIGRVGAGGSDVVLVGCDRSASGGADTFEGAPVLPVTCAGNLHTSVVEYLIRAGAGGVLVVACPERDCWSREGPKWLYQRLYEEREAELQDRVDRNRIHLVYRSSAERAELAAELAAFRERVVTQAGHGAEDEIDLLTMCESAGGDRVITAVGEEQS